MDRTSDHPAYANSPAVERKKATQARSGKQPGDPQKAAEIMCDLAEHSDPPLRIILGNPAADLMQKKLETYKDSLSKWDEVSRSCDYPEGQLFTAAYGICSIVAKSRYKINECQ